MPSAIPEGPTADADGGARDRRRVMVRVFDDADPTPPDAGPLWQQLETSYHLAVRLNVRTGTAKVIETLDVRNPTDEPLSRLDLSILAAATDEFELKSLTRDGAALRPRWTNKANLAIDLEPPLAKGATRVVVTFRVHPSRDTRSSLATRTSNADGIIRFGGWFPIVSDGHGFRRPGDSQVTAAATAFRLDLHLDRAAVVAAPGDVLIKTKRHRVFELRGARDLAFAVSERFVTSSRRVHGVTIESYTLPGGPAKTALRSAARALGSFGSSYGPYPYDRFVLVQSPRTRIGNEYPGIVFLGVESLADPVVVAHETAHQWFYGIVGSDQLREPWLDEALAEFAAGSLYDKLEPACDPRTVASPVTAFPDHRDTQACGGYSDTVYLGGAAFVAEVRSQLGPQRFDEAMRAYVSAQAGRIATTDDLVGAWLDAAADPDELRATIDKALYGAAR